MLREGEKLRPSFFLSIELGARGDRLFYFGGRCRGGQNKTDDSSKRKVKVQSENFWKIGNLGKVGPFARIFSKGKTALGA